MAKLVLDDIGSTLTNTAATTINNNNNKIEQALENTLSRDGSTPNNMQADIDMDSNDILNVGTIDTETLTIDGVPVQAVGLANALKISNALNELAPLGLADDAVDNLGLGPLQDSIPNPSSNVQGTGIPGIDGGNWMIWNSPTSFDEDSTLRVDRHMPTGSTGVAGNTYSAIWALGSSPATNLGYEWVGKFELHNKALGSGGAQNVAINGTAFKETSTGQVGPTWGGNFNVSDLTGQVDPLYSAIGVEIDCAAMSTAGTDANRQRVGIQLSMPTFDGVNPASPLHFGYGLLVSSDQVNCVIDRAIALRGPGSYEIGIDASHATFSGPVLGMAEDQFIAFDLLPSGFFARKLFYDSGNLAYAVSGVNKLTLSDAGLLSLSGGLAAGGPISAVGAIGATTTVTAGTGLIATTGGVTASAGDIVATTGKLGVGMTPTHTADITGTLRVSGRSHMGTGDTLNVGLLNLETTIATDIGVAVQGFTGQTANLMQCFNSGGTTVSRITAAGNVGGVGAYTDLSDERSKHDIADATDGLETILGLKPKRYIRNGSEVEELGFVAQQVQSVLPEAVAAFDPNDPDSMLGITTTPIIAALVNAVKELSARVASMEAQLVQGTEERYRGGF